MVRDFVDLTQPYDEVLDVVQQVTNDGVIRAPYQYKGTNELMEPNSEHIYAFSPWTGQARLSTDRPHAPIARTFLSEQRRRHRRRRYIVEPLTPSGTRLRIDAVFVEAVASQTSGLDGQVENRNLRPSPPNAGHRDTEAKKRGKLLHDHSSDNSSNSGSVG